jgi:hypothetical protein
MLFDVMNLAAEWCNPLRYAENRLTPEGCAGPAVACIVQLPLHHTDNEAHACIFTTHSATLCCYMCTWQLLPMQLAYRGSSAALVTPPSSLQPHPAA